MKCREFKSLESPGSPPTRTTGEAPAEQDREKAQRIAPDGVVWYHSAMILSHDFPVLSNLLVGLVLFAGMIGTMLLGRRRGQKVMAGLTEDLPGLGAVEAALFGIFGLLMAFTFSGATDRFAERRSLILREADISGTAYARLDLLPEPARKDLQARFRSYLQARIDAYARVSTLTTLEADLREITKQGSEIWRLAATACRAPDCDTFAEVVLPPINEMLDVANDRTAALRKHPPKIIYLFLFVLSLICAFLAGFSMARGSVLSKTHVIGFALMISLTICVTLDLEHPRFGLIGIRDMDQLLRLALDRMK